MNKAFLDGYGGQTLQQLIALRSSHRIDSLVLAVEQALLQKPETALTEPERVVIAVEAMEREVNNGGYGQFFLNSPRESEFIVRALELIGCPKTAAISSDAIAALALPEGFDSKTVERAVSKLSDAALGELAECDSRYYANGETIDERLFSYIERHQNEIRIPHVV
jgi:hypothetical protein